MKIAMLFNQRAGRGTSLGALRQMLARAGHEVVRVIEHRDQAAHLADPPAELVVAAGGDGTFAAAARALAGSSIPLALLPIGTANNVAHSLDLLGEAEELAANLQGAPTRPLDLGSVKGPWGERSFIEAVGLGAFAPAITRSDPKPPFEHRIRLGREALCEAIAAAEPHRIALSVDGEPLDGEFLFVEVLNLRFSGPRLPIAYFAEPGDQMLDIVHLCEHQRQAMLDWVRSTPEETPPPVLVHIGRNVKMAWDGAPLRLDDRVCPPKDGPHVIDITLEQDSLRVLCP